MNNSYQVKRNLAFRKPDTKTDRLPFNRCECGAYWQDTGYCCNGHPKKVERKE